MYIYMYIYNQQLVDWLWLTTSSAKHFCLQAMEEAKVTEVEIDEVRRWKSWENHEKWTWQCQNGGNG